MPNWIYNLISFCMGYVIGGLMTLIVVAVIVAGGEKHENHENV
jgi:hypothetical protein